MINKPPPMNRDDNRDPDIKALKRSGFINQGSTLGLMRGSFLQSMPTCFCIFEWDLLNL